MSKLLKRKTPDIVIENKICTGCIVSDQYLKEIISVYNPSYIQNKYAQTVCNWAMDYFDMYHKAPKIHIADIFDIEKEEMDRAEIELIDLLLENVNVNYMETGINDQYILDQTIKYFRKREIEILANNLVKYIEFNKVDKAEDAILNYRKVAKATSGWYNPFISKYIEDVFDDSNQGIFQFPGELGKLIGPIERDWFVAIIGKFKTGKSWWLQEIAFLALMERLKVAFFSLEMQRKGVDKRLYQRITAFSEGGEEVAYPVFDCKRNQSGQCEKSERTNEYSLLDENDEKPEFDSQLLYRPCVACREKYPEDFELDSWFETIKPSEFNAKQVRKRVSVFTNMYSQNLRVKCYPRFTASLSDIIRDLEILEESEDFIPDVIIIDYADILKPETKSEGTDALDDIWKKLASLAAVKHSILFTASQGNRGSLNKKTMTEEDMAGWIGKLGHVDIFMAINRTDMEKKAGMTRIGLLAHRHRDYNPMNQCTVLQNYSIGQVDLDNQIDRSNKPSRISTSEESDDFPVKKKRRHKS